MLANCRLGPSPAALHSGRQSSLHRHSPNYTPSGAGPCAARHYGSTVPSTADRNERVQLQKGRPSAAGRGSSLKASASGSGGDKPLWQPTSFSFQTAWPWEFMPCKPEVVECAPSLLMGVKLAHYFTLIAQGFVSWTLFQARDWMMGKGAVTAAITAVKGAVAKGVAGKTAAAVAAATSSAAAGPHLWAWLPEGLSKALGISASLATPLSELGVFLLILGSVYQAMAGAFFIMAHEFDGWQIATYAWPNKDTTLDPTKQNDDRLRLVSYQFLWMFQALGMGVSAFGVTQAAVAAAWPGLAACAPLLWPGVAAALVLVWFVGAKWAPSIFFNSPAGKYPVMVTPQATLVLFISFATAYGLSVAALFGAAWPLAVAAVVCFVLGGGTEAFGAEGSLEQWYHLVAVVVISIGAVLLVMGLHITSSGAAVAPWTLPGVQAWLAMLGVAAAAMMAKARFVSLGAK